VSIKKRGLSVPRCYADEVDATLTEHRIIILNSSVDASMLSCLSYRLRFMVLQNKEPITIYFSTPGGTVMEGLAVYDLIKGVTKDAPVTMIAYGMCMSMGLVIVQAATKRLSAPHTTFLLHEVQLSDMGRASLTAREDEQSEAKRIQAMLDEILTTRTGQDMKKLRKEFARRELYLSAEEALSHKLIDGIVEK